MEIPSKNLIAELEKNLLFWLKSVYNDTSLIMYPEVSITGVPNTSATLGSMFLSRILYGTSCAYKILKNEDYLKLANYSYLKLKEFEHPKGGYYWAKDTSEKFLNDADNTCMAQAFALYGLVAYAKVNPSKEINNALEKQFNFIQNTLKDVENGGYLDGFNEHWELGESATKALGTHLHLLEAFVSLYEYSKDEKLVTEIEVLITIISSRFITKNTFDCLHRLTPNWKPLPNEVWAGHNAETSWILCHSANVIKNQKLIMDCNELAIKMMEQVVLKAFDKKNQGVFNVLKDDIPSEKVKIWWPQAETVLGLLNCYRITKDENYKNQAIDLINYISNNFTAPNGEWFTEIWNNKTPNTSQPLVHFWKSMYHTVRYYVQIIELK